MGKQISFGVAQVARKAKQPYFGVAQVARKVKNGYVGVGGVARQFYSSAYTWKKYNVNTTYNGLQQVKSTGSNYSNGDWGSCSHIGEKTSSYRRSYYWTSYTVDSTTGLTTLSGQQRTNINRTDETTYPSNTDVMTGIKGWFIMQSTELLGTVSTANKMNEMGRLNGNKQYDSEAPTVLTTLNPTNHYIFNGEFMLDGSSRALYIVNCKWYLPKPVYACGSLIGTVENESASAYPTNGRHTDGYWYILQS